jgi:hypothetical protein
MKLSLAIDGAEPAIAEYLHEKKSLELVCNALAAENRDFLTIMLDGHNCLGGAIGEPIDLEAFYALEDQILRLAQLYRERTVRQAKVGPENFGFEVDC